MLDPEQAGAWLEHHFATVTPEEFIANVRRSDPEFAQEMWGDLSAAEVLARGTQARCGGGNVAGHDSAARLPGSGEGATICPESARAVLKEYDATASAQQIVDDPRRHSPELARRLGVDAAAQRQAIAGSGGMRSFLSLFRRSVLRLFS